MFRRLVVVFMLVLFPLQWSVAQDHELADDASIFAVAPSDFVHANELLIHTDEPGGICQFHLLSQISAAANTPCTADFSARDNEAWKVHAHLTSPGSLLPSEIEKPKWSLRPPQAAVS